MAAQQARLVALAPGSAAVVLSLNAAALYLGSAIGSAIGSFVIGGAGLVALGWTASGLAFFAALHMAVSARVSGDYRV